MKIAVMGSGAIGGYFGGRLAAHGTDVSFIARGAHLAAIRSNGLRIDSALGNALIKPAKATDDPNTIGPVDYVLFCVKLYDVEAAAALISQLIGPKTVVVTTQNGVDARERLAPILGEAHVMGGVAQIGSAVPEPGVIRHSGKLARLIFGDKGGKVSERARALEAECKAAGIDATASDRIDLDIWQKFIMLAAMSGVASLSRQPAGAIQQTPALTQLFRDAVAEVDAVARKLGVPLAPEAIDRVMQGLQAFPPDGRPSMLQDLERGYRLEVPWLSGKVAELGQQHGVPTPIHRTIAACLAPYVAGKSPAPPRS